MQWPDQRAANWSTLIRAAGELAPELADRVVEAHNLWTADGQTEQDRCWLAQNELAVAAATLDGVLSSAAFHLTLVEVDGWTVLLDGGVMSGEDPTPTSYGPRRSRRPGCSASHSSATPGRRRRSLTSAPDTPLLETVHPISEPSRLVVVAFPLDVRWENAAELTQPSDVPLLTRLAEVVAGRHSRRAKRLQVGETTLLVGDPGDPTGIAETIWRLEASDVLAAVGARVLDDIPTRTQPRNCRRRPMSEPFLIDTFDGSLIVIPLGEARRLAALNSALENSGTWGEFLEAVAADRATTNYLARMYGGELPAPDHSFDPDEVPGFADGDWPSWPKRAMLDWLPASVQELGTIQDTLLNGECLQLDESLIEDVIEALRAEEIESYEDPADLITTACGARRYR